MTTFNTLSSHKADAQKMQDCIWNHYQVNDTVQFDLSYPRLDYLASRFKRGQSVLNIGVGNGYMEEQMHYRGIRVYALDPSPKTMDQLKERIPIGDRGRVGYSQTIPFDSGYFDGVIMTEVLEHLTDEALAQTLKEVYRVLKPGGFFIGTVPYMEDLNTNMVICPCCQNIFHRWGHYQMFDTNKMKHLLMSEGFHVRRIYTRTFPQWKRKNPVLLMKSAIRFILGRLGESIINPNLFFASQKPNS